MIRLGRTSASCVLIPALVLCLATGTATAERVAKGTKEIDSVRPVIASIKREGDAASMIVLVMYRRMQTGYVGSQSKPEAYYYGSTRSKIEYDCRQLRSRIIHTVFFSDKVGQGSVVHEQNVNGAWMRDEDHKDKDSLHFVACEAPLAGR